MEKLGLIHFVVSFGGMIGGFVMMYYWKENRFFTGIVRGFKVAVVAAMIALPLYPAYLYVVPKKQTWYDVETESVQAEPEAPVEQPVVEEEEVATEEPEVVAAEPASTAAVEEVSEGGSEPIEAYIHRKMVDYAEAMVTAINTGDAGYIDEYTWEASDIRPQQYALVERLYEAGITERLLSMQVDRIEDAEDGEYYITTTEIHEITKPTKTYRVTNRFRYWASIYEGDELKLYSMNAVQ